MSTFLWLGYLALLTAFTAGTSRTGELADHIGRGLLPDQEVNLPTKGPLSNLDYLHGAVVV